MFAPTYFDHNATTPLDPRVLEAMLPYLREQYGNASSRHEYGRAARRAVDEARQKVAAAVGAHPTEVLFTSGGSEANNLFIKGAATVRREQGRFPFIAISAIEHPCVREPARQLAKAGGSLREIAVDAAGCIERDDFLRAVEERPALVSVMLANNETGVMQDVAGLAALAHPAGAWFHSDAVQALGKQTIDFRTLNAAGVQALTLSAHKVGGPKGAGALVLDKRVELVPQIAGGGQERGYRSGTENVAALVGFGEACQWIPERLACRAQLRLLRDALEEGLRALGAHIFGEEAERLANTVYFSLPEIEGETLVGKLDRAGFAVASGAACSSAQPEPSHVLQAMGVPEVLLRGAVRVSLGPDNTARQVQDFLAALGDTLSQLRRLAALAG
ncbi:MAG: cysteine desulfurase [Sterolibacterium sp.]|nr:cysteine desulfurase [Sterolibacterium sp.]MBP9799061.1 cysteine desulfurase [Sterolibacterium sp.]